MIYTVGHSNLNFMRFISLIQANNINHIIDIRSIPYSRRAAWSSKSRLAELLRPFRIRYTYLGHKLGGKKQNIDRYSKQQGVTPQEIYNEGIRSLIHLSMRDNLCLLCAEGDPENCHRQHIVAQSLIAVGVTVIHILSDGSLKEAWKETPSPIQQRLFQ